MNTEDEEAAQSRHRAEQRRSQFVESIDASLKAREDKAPQTLSAMNASRVAKLSKLNRLAGELMQAAQPFVACKSGCAACCHMNVTISSSEAQAIERATGLKAATLHRSQDHHGAKFVAVPCPFLRNSLCTIYEVRPMACRTHMSFDVSSHWCQPERMHQHEMPLLHFDGIRSAYASVIQDDVVADIRDFFPQS